MRVSSTSSAMTVVVWCGVSQIPHTTQNTQFYCEARSFLILKLSLRVPTADIVSRVLIESSTLDPGMATEQAGLFSSQVKPVEVDSQKVMCGG
ncbi:hypothetical protein TNCV_1533431 [Trichonephila clavipes]|nr:hypothetical protein TNCV_1533431 [Trichonephila clavipes]